MIDNAEWILMLTEPTPDMVRFADIARGLSREGRYTNQTELMWTVAEHSMLMARNLPFHLKKFALLHDAPEAYLRDIPSPFKKMLSDYKIIEQRVWCVVAERFGIPEELPPEIKEADLRALATEKRDLLPDEPEWKSLHGVEPYREKIHGHVETLPFREIELAYMRDYVRCGNTLSNTDKKNLDKIRG